MRYHHASRSRRAALVAAGLFFGCSSKTPDDWGVNAGNGVGGGDGGKDAAPTARDGSFADLPTIENPCGAVDSSLTDQATGDLFGANKIPTFDFYLPGDSWEALKANARAEQFVPAQACFEGKAVGLVGLRFKGSYGSLFNCFDAEGKNTCRKLSMKVKFNEYVSGQHFFGLKRLNFHGYRYDDTYLKEHLSYDLYRAMGVVAPRTAWALLRVNGEPQGLFGMVEQPDGRFVKDRWPDQSEGNLYKEIWPGQTDTTWIQQHLETNEDAADVTRLQAFSRALNSAGESELRAVLGAHMDLAYFARYMAVDDAIANFDGITTYYTSGNPDEAGNHNFYLYEDTPDHYTLVPWDLEATLYLAAGFGNIPPWQTAPADCNRTYPVWSGDSQVIAPGCNPVFRALAADLTDYRTEARKLLDGPFSLDQMLASVDTHAAFLRAEAIADPHGPGAEDFENSVSYLRQQVPKLRRRLEQLVSGEPIASLEIDLTKTTDMESVSGYGLVAGTEQLSNPNTTASVELNTANPIGGAKTLRIQFEFRNENTPWNQWSFYRVPLASAPKDLSSLTGIRMKLRADPPRTLRVDIDSPHNSAADEGIQIGWERQVTTTAAEYSFQLADAAVPDWAAIPDDHRSDVLRTATGFTFRPICNGRSDAGQLPDETTDQGWIDIDDIQFF